MIVSLAGGVGAARFLTGLVRVVPEEESVIIVNTGDDIELHGLHISPDIDIILYTLAGIVDEEKGWGVRGDTFNCLKFLAKLGCETWFKLGDMDLATHIFRTNLLKRGFKLSEVVDDIRRRFGLKVKVLPMSDQRVETRIVTDIGELHFQEYLVKRGASDRVLGVKFAGIEEAEPTPGLIESILEAEAVVVCPSNPIVSIGPILSVKGVREALLRSEAKKIAISPIVAGRPIKGPADKLMQGLGLEVSAYSVAKLYSDFLDVFIIDQADIDEKDRIERLGIKAISTNTIMRDLKDKVNLAKVVIEQVRGSRNQIL
ncbi:2-phospho-L-lactate transferase [Candidatus Bathyarchaeota archaeon]|nr:2-phospho-L-lactate transferase [Candidatus Bathyarchaeota archaeon]